MWFWTLYILLCLIAGLLGRNSRLGVWGTAALSFIITPVISLLILLLFAPANKSSAVDDNYLN